MFILFQISETISLEKKTFLKCLLGIEFDHSYFCFENEKNKISHVSSEVE